MGKVLFLGDEGYLSQLFELALSKEAKPNFDYEFFTQRVDDPDSSGRVVNLVSKLDLRRWRRSASLREKLVSEDFDHIHCLGPDLVDFELFSEVGITYSISCSASPIAEVIDQVTISRVSALRQSEFVACNGDWMQKELRDKTGIAIDRLHSIAWPIPFSNVAELEIQRDGILVATERFNSETDPYAVLEFLDQICHAESVTIVSSKPCPIEEPVGFSWYQLNANSHLIAQLMRRSRLGVVLEQTTETPALLVHMLSAGLPVVAPQALFIGEYVLDSLTGLVVRPELQEFANAVASILDSYRRHDAMSKNSIAYYEHHFSCAEALRVLSDQIQAVLSNPPKRQRTVIDLIDGIEIGRNMDETISI